MNSAEKAAMARKANENAKRAKRRARREKIGDFRVKIGDFFESVGDFFGKIWNFIKNADKVFFLYCFIAFFSALIFILEAAGAAGMRDGALQLQKTTFYISIAVFIVDVVFFLLALLGPLLKFSAYDVGGDWDSIFVRDFVVWLLCGVFGVALFVMGCVSLGMGRMALKNLYYDETYGVVYAERGTDYLVWHIDDDKEDVLILTEYNGMKVSEVRGGAAKNNTKMKTLTFAPRGEYTLGKAAFRNCTSLSTVSFGGSSEFHIQKKVFADCGRLTTVDCGTENKLTFEDGGVFDVCPLLTEFRVNNSELYGAYATYSFSGTTNVTVYVNGGTFDIFDSLKEIVAGMNSTVRVRGIPSKDIDTIVKRYRFEDGFDFTGSEFLHASIWYHLFSDSTLDYYPLAEEIDLPSSVTYIPDNFFGEYDTCKVYYAGTEAQWKALKIGENGNDNYANGKVTVVYEYSE